jgi:hypothetical protein
MLLRSISKHVKEQNWFAVVLDFLIVVIGILIAFQITNWNEARQNKDKAELFIERLEQDFVDQLKISNRSLALHKQALEATARLIEGVRSGSFDDAKLSGDITDATSIASPPGASTAFRELVSSGNTDLIRSDPLRNQLYAYNNFLSLYHDSYMQYLTPIDQANEALVSARTLVASGEPISDYDQLFRNQSVDSSVLLADKKLIDLLQLSYMRHENIHVNFSSMRKRIDGILTLIRAEQGNKQ